MIKDFLVEGSDYLLSYSKISGKKVKDIIGYVSTEYAEPTFKICQIIFDDGTEQYVEGEHDFPYLVDDNERTLDLLDKINKEQEAEDN